MNVVFLGFFRKILFLYKCYCTGEILINTAINVIYKYLHSKQKDTMITYKLNIKIHIKMLKSLENDLTRQKQRISI